jgi:hypothetical protein
VYNIYKSIDGQCSWQAEVFSIASGEETNVRALVNPGCWASGNAKLACRNGIATLQDRFVVGGAPPCTPITVRCKDDIILRNYNGGNCSFEFTAGSDTATQIGGCGNEGTLKRFCDCKTGETKGYTDYTCNVIILSKRVTVYSREDRRCPPDVGDGKCAEPTASGLSVNGPGTLTISDYTGGISWNATSGALPPGGRKSPGKPNAGKLGVYINGANIGYIDSANGSLDIGAGVKGELAFKYEDDNCSDNCGYWVFTATFGCG